jgi:Protein of unknown function (DUF4238)
MAAPKQQHIIPAVHLRHFAGSDPAGHVWTYDALSGRSWSAIPEETATEGYFYSGELDDGTMDMTIEELFSRIEDHAKPGYDALLAGEIPGPTQARIRMDFAHFLGLMYVRTRAMRRASAEMQSRFRQTLMYAHAQHEDAFKRVVGSYEQEIGKELSPESRENVRQDMLDPSGYEFEIPKEWTFTVLPLADDLARILYRMRWTLLTANESCFVTSDNPLVCEVHTDRPRREYGFLDKEAEVTFPLSPTKLLLMTWQEVEGSPDLNAEIVTMANMVRAALSDQYLYAHIKDDAINRLAEYYKDSRFEMTTHGYGPKKFGRTRVPRRRRE